MTDTNKIERGADKVRRLPIKVAQAPKLAKPSWLKVRAVAADEATMAVREIIRTHKLSTVCKEANCPNMGECFKQGTATFLIMGDKCTRRCPFCDVGHGRPDPLDPSEPERLANAIALMNLKYAVITSVDRDDLEDGGAAHYSACIRAVRKAVPGIKVEILVPDYRGRLELALEHTDTDLPDVFNHNIETVPSLYKTCRPAASYEHSLKLLRLFKERHPDIPTKSGLMLGLGETDEEVMQTLRDLRANNVDIVTIGQYLAPTTAHVPVRRYVSPEQFEWWKKTALEMGFTGASCGVFVRSSYHAADTAKEASSVA